MLFDELRALYIFEGVTDDALRDLADKSEIVTFKTGDVLYKQGDPADFWWVLLEGHLELMRKMSTREETVVGGLMKPGDWGGGLQAWAPVSYVASGRGGEGRVLKVPAPVLRETVTRVFPMAMHLMSGYFRTVRMFEAVSREWGALITLGELSAGLAHELNNPASAATRSVDALRSTTDTLLGSLEKLAAVSMTAEQFTALDRLRGELQRLPSSTDPMEMSDREEAVAGWLDSHGIEEAWDVAPALAAAGADVPWLERARTSLPEATLAPGLEWVASCTSTQSLLDEVKEATKRISQLVDAVRPYSNLGRASSRLIDVTEGIESTLVMLGPKLKNGVVTIVRDYGSDVPRIQANPGELNQVWTNLIGNAIDAMDGSGTLTLTTRVDGDDVVVSVGDTGPGMPPEVKAHAFDAFFTTKEVGKGTGLGLEISRRLVVERHDGSIEIDSEPGRTVLTVRLPRPKIDSAQADSTNSDDVQ